MLSTPGASKSGCLWSAAPGDDGWEHALNDVYTAKSVNLFLNHAPYVGYVSRYQIFP